MIDRAEIDGPHVASNFICRRVQPCKERVHRQFEYEGREDATRERAAALSTEVIADRLEALFNTTNYSWLEMTSKFFSLENPLPLVS